METLEVSRSDLRFIFRAIDTALAEIDNGVTNGDIHEEVLFELESAHNTLEDILKGK